MKPRNIEEISSKIQEQTCRKGTFSPVDSLNTVTSLRQAYLQKARRLLRSQFRGSVAHGAGSSLASW